MNSRKRYNVGSISGILLVSLFIIGIAFILRDHEVDCDKDPPIIFKFGDGDGDGDDENNKISIDSCFVYSETYYEARNKFHNITKELYPSSKLYTYNITKDDNNTYYTMDIVIIKGTVPGTVVHTSGVHGVEGYAGSAIQISFLKYILPNILLRKSYPTFIIIHSINPYGMANYRRFNENNVDLNRNGLSGRFGKLRSS